MDEDDHLEVAPGFFDGRAPKEVEVLLHSDVSDSNQAMMETKSSENIGFEVFGRIPRCITAQDKMAESVHAGAKIFIPSSDWVRAVMPQSLLELDIVIN